MRITQDLLEQPIDENIVFVFKPDSMILGTQIIGFSTKNKKNKKKRRRSGFVFIIISILTLIIASVFYGWGFGITLFSGSVIVWLIVWLSSFSKIFSYEYYVGDKGAMRLKYINNTKKIINRKIFEYNKANENLNTEVASYYYKGNSYTMRFFNNRKKIYEFESINTLKTHSINSDFAFAKQVKRAWEVYQLTLVLADLNNNRQLIINGTRSDAFVRFDEFEFECIIDNESAYKIRTSNIKEIEITGSGRTVIHSYDSKQKLKIELYNIDLINIIIGIIQNRISPETPFHNVN